MQREAHGGDATKNLQLGCNQTDVVKVALPFETEAISAKVAIEPFFGKIFSGSTNDFQKDSLLFLFFGVFGYPRQRKYQGVPKTIKTITPVLNVARMSFAIFEKNTQAPRFRLGVERERPF